jgi:protein-L-isoaspartate(D-aspartate) O-methyltransferase
MQYFNYEQAKFNMLEQQIRPWEVLNQQVLDCMAKVEREKFVPREYQKLAYADFEIPLAHAQLMMPPRLEGRLLQSLNLQPTDSVLEIGTGSGYLTALLASLSKQVDSVDIYADFIAQAEVKLAEFTNVSLGIGNAAAGWKTDLSYDVIVLTGSVKHLPEQFKLQLKPQGRLFAIVGKPPIMEAVLITRFSEREWIYESLFETSIPSLIELTPTMDFVF